MHILWLSVLEKVEAFGGPGKKTWKTPTGTLWRAQQASVRTVANMGVAPSAPRIGVNKGLCWEQPGEQAGATGPSTNVPQHSHCKDWKKKTGKVEISG